MKISIFVPLGNIGNTPDYWQYAWREAIKSYLDFADEVVIVYGSDKEVQAFESYNWQLNKKKITKKAKEKIKVIYSPWKYDFSWETISQHFNAGLEACTGDWIIKMDIDYIIHEDKMKKFRQLLEVADANGFELASYMKATVLNKDVYYQKLAVPFCINGKFKNKYKFGIPIGDKKSAWGYPIIADGFDKKRGLPTGKNIPEPLDIVAFRTGIDVYNYDNTFRNKEITAEHFLRFSNARANAGFPREWGSTREEALQKFIDMFDSRFEKTKHGIRKRFKDHGGHPKYIKERIEGLTPDLFGYNNWK